MNEVKIIYIYKGDKEWSGIIVEDEFYDSFELDQLRECTVGSFVYSLVFHLHKNDKNLSTNRNREYIEFIIKQLIEYEYDDIIKFPVYYE